MVRVDGRGDSHSLIQIRGLDKTYRRGGEEMHVLQGLSLDVGKGEFVAFMGAERVRKDHSAQFAGRIGRAFGRENCCGWR